MFLLWDHDGVIVDTERWYFEATRRILEGLGIELSQQRYLELMAQGRPCWDLARERGVAEADVSALRKRRNTVYRDLLRTQPILIAGVAEALAELAADHRMGIVTTARRADLDLIHAKQDLLEHFEFVLTVEDYERAKPHPDPYLAGLARFGAAPDLALAIEDSARGLASARSAGIDCLVIRNDFTASQDFSGAWRVVDSIASVPELLRA